MTYELSVSPEFFYAEGEPYDASYPTVNVRGEPLSLYSALLLLPFEWQADARAVLRLGDVLQWDDVCCRLVEMAQDTNTCGCLSSPVEVWIDPAGEMIVKVYDGDPLPPGWPTAPEVAKALVEHTADLPKMADDDQPHDVRLQVLKAQEWLVHVGDPSYDNDHHGYWGAGMCSGPLTLEEATEAAVSMLEEAADSYYQE